MRYTVRLVFSVVLSLLIGLSTLVFAEDPPQYLELLLKINKQGRITILKQTFRNGKLPGPKAPEFQEGFWSLQAQTAAGEDVYTSAMPDPRILYVDGSDPTQPGRLTGGPILLEDAVFPVRLPKDTRIKQLKFSRLKHAVARPKRDPKKAAQATGAAAGSLLPEDALEHLETLSLENP